MVVIIRVVKAARIPKHHTGYAAKSWLKKALTFRPIGVTLLKTWGGDF